MVRAYLPHDFKVDQWQNLEPWYRALLDAPITSLHDLELWLQHRSEIESVVSENLGWRYIRMTCDTANPDFLQDYEYFITHIEPNLQPIVHKLNEKLLLCIYSKELAADAYQLLLKAIRNHFSIYREENIPLLTEMQQLQVKYGSIVGQLTVHIDNEEITLQKASTYLYHTDRAKREEAWRKINTQRLRVSMELNDLFDKLVHLRHTIATQAGFENYRDYMFVELCRFDYTAEDCFRLHKAIQKAVMPLVEKILQNRKKVLGYESLRPWDLNVDLQSLPPLKPFENGRELTEKTRMCFQKLHPEIAQVIRTMEQMNRLDLESRKGKAPGGYNYPLYETGIPFIFMNAAGTVRDLVTMVHEGGHALHAVLTKDLPLLAFKNVPSEVAELASMGMELLSMEHWDVFFTHEQDFRRAKKEHLLQIIETLPWVAAIDKFQHFLYENPTHSPDERTQQWLQIQDMFGVPVVDWTGLETARENLWQKQLHLYEVPFYYIEYGIAQLGAIAIWRNYKRNPEKTLEQYMNALRLGYTMSIPKIYETAGIRFEFSESYIAELMQFVWDEYEKL